MITTLYDQLKEACKSYTEDPFLASNKAQLTFGQVREEVDLLAEVLRENNVSRGERILYIANKSVDSLLLHLACSKIGAIYSVIDVRADTEKNQSLINRYAPLMIFLDDDADTSRYKLEAFKANEIDAEGRRALVSRRKPVIDSREPIGSDIGLVFFTSGSTGDSKGVALSHRSVLFVGESITEYLKLGKDDIIYNALPLFFDYGYYQVLFPLFSGCSTYIATSFMIPQKNIKELRDISATVLPLVPSMARLLAKTKDVSVLEKVKKITNTGEAIHESEINQIQRYFPNANIYSMYGLTECKRTTYLPPEEYRTKPDSVGIAIPGTRVEICNEYNVVVEPGEVGQVVVSGPHLMTEYLDMPIETAETLFYDSSDKQMKLATGDFGYQDANGYLYLCGRKDDVYKIDGRKYSCIENEMILKEIDCIDDSCVIVHPDTREITAFIVSSNEDAVSDQQIKKELMCRSVLSSHIPREIVRMSEFPLNQNGKHDKKKLILEHFNLIKKSAGTASDKIAKAVL